MLTEIECDLCHKKFNRELRKYQRHKHKFCCKKCQDEFNGNRQRDESSPFRYFIQKVDGKSRSHNEISDIDLDFLKSLWKRQRGICPYSGLKMKLPKTCKETINSPQRASLDRIDSSRGYFQDNVEFVCQFVNLGKNTFSKKEIKNLFNKMKRNLTKRLTRKKKLIS